MSEGAPDFYHKNNVYIKKSDVNIPVSIEESKVTIDANITNSELNVNISAQEAPVEITGDVNVTGGSIDAKITNTPIDVNVQGGSIDANITNAEIDVNIRDSQVTLEVMQSDWKISDKRYTITSYEGNEDRKLNPVYIVITHGAMGILASFQFLAKTLDGLSHTITVEFRSSFEGEIIHSESFNISSTDYVELTIRYFKMWMQDSIYIKIYADDSDNVVIYTATNSEPKAIWFNPETNVWEIGDCPVFDLHVFTFNTPSIAVSGQTATLLQGFDYTNKKWVPLKVTSDGKLLAVLG